MNNQQLKQMVQIALENSLFDNETDPDGAIKRGLDYLISEGDWDQEIIDARISSEDDWDGLEEWAAYLGTRPRRRKPGGGRKPRHGEAMVQLQARVPPAIRAQLIAEFGSVQKAVNALIIEPRLDAAEVRK